MKDADENTVITINGHRLTTGQVIALRVSVAAMLTELEDPEERQHIGPIADGYRTRLGEIQRFVIDAGADDQVKTTLSHLVVASGNGELLCRHCGGSYTINTPCSIDMVSASANVFVKEHARCTMQPGSPAARDSLPPGEMTPEQWLQSGDTGRSSLTIWAVMTGRTNSRRGNDVPLDPDDFGRCFRLLEHFPAWRGRIAEVGGRFPEWKPIVDAWPELEALYREELPTGSAPKLYKQLLHVRRTHPCG